MSKHVALCLSIVLLWMFCSCAQGEAPQSFLDMTEREIVLAEPITRVVVLDAADCEILCALGAGDALVGRGEFCNEPAEILHTPSVNSGYELNLEQVIALAPQAVIMTKMGQSVDQIAALESAGIAVIVTDAQNIDGVYEAITLIGRMMNRTAEADALIADMRSKLDAIRQAVQTQSGKSIYFEVSPLQWGLWTAGTDTFMNELAELCGLRNIFADVSGWAAISEEQVLARNPDVIVTITPVSDDAPLPEDEICIRAGWDSLSAVQNSAVYRLDSDAVSRPGPRLADAAQALYTAVYGKQP